MRDLSYYSEYYIDLSVTLPPTNPANIFHNNHNTVLEIGFGDGDFLIELASKNPDLNFIGIEIKKGRFIKAISAAHRQKLKNIKFLHFDASINLLQVFSPHSFYKIYINFPDPWPKDRHKKHRIITTTILDQFHKLTTDTAFIEIASDHKEYIEVISETFREHGGFSLSAHLVYMAGYPLPIKTITKFEKDFINRRSDIYYMSYQKKMGGKNEFNYSSYNYNTVVTDCGL